MQCGDVPWGRTMGTCRGDAPWVHHMVAPRGSARAFGWGDPTAGNPTVDPLPRDPRERPPAVTPTWGTPSRGPPPRLSLCRWDIPMGAPCCWAPFPPPWSQKAPSSVLPPQEQQTPEPAVLPADPSAPRHRLRRRPLHPTGDLLQIPGSCPTAPWGHPAPWGHQEPRGAPTPPQHHRGHPGTPRPHTSHLRGGSGVCGACSWGKPCAVRPSASQYIPVYPSASQCSGDPCPVHPSTS